MAAKARTKTRTNNNDVKWYEPQKPDFIKLKQGELFEGIFIGLQPGRFGVSYLFKAEGNGQPHAVGGNRVHLDRAFKELIASGDFGPDGPSGHLLAVNRMKTEKTGSGRTVHIFRVGHVVGRCPRCVGSSE